MMKTVLSIAGSDCSGGAGVQADLKTLMGHKVYGMCAITALTAQNTTGVQGIKGVSPRFLKMQLESVFHDIYPDAVKIGMIGTGENVQVIAEILETYPVRSVVIDPVLVSTSGSPLLLEAERESYEGQLLPMADLITPNIPEAEVLSGIKIDSEKSMEKAAIELTLKYHTNILVKGGHSRSSASDLLCLRDGGMIWYPMERIEAKNTHGTGCTLSSALAANLAYGFCMEDAVLKSKAYITGLLRDGMDLGKGNGPLNHALGGHT